MKKIANEIAVNGLKRIKKSGGLELQFIEHIENKDGTVENKDWTLKYDAVPHNDLYDGLYDLKQYLASCYGMLDISVVMKEKGLQAGAKAAFKTVSPYLDKMMRERLMKLEINGYSVTGSIQGDKDKRGVIILGTFTHPNGSKTALNSPLIKFNQDEFKFEGDVKVIIDNLEEEVQMYLSGEKRNAPELFTDNDSSKEKKEMKVA